MKIPSEIELPRPKTKPNYFSIDLKIAVWIIGLAWMQFRFRHLNWIQKKERKITGYLNKSFFPFLLLLLGKIPFIQTCVSEIIFIDSFTYAILFWNLFLVKIVLCMELVYFVVIVITNSSILNSALIMKKLFYCLIISYICQFKVQYNLVGFLILKTNSLYVSPALSLLLQCTNKHICASTKL